MSIDEFRVNSSVFGCGGAWQVLKSVCDGLKFTKTEWDAAYDDDDPPDLWFGCYVTVKPPRKGSRHRTGPHGLYRATGKRGDGTCWFGYKGQGDEKARPEVHLYCSTMGRAQ